MMFGPVRNVNTVGRTAESGLAGLRFVLSRLAPFRWKLSWACVGVVLDALLTAARPWPLKVVIDRALGHRSTHVPLIGPWLDHLRLAPMQIVVGACIVTLSIALGSGLLTYGYTYVLGVSGQQFVYELRGELFAHLQRLSLRFHDRQRTGDLMTRLTGDIQAIQDSVATGVAVVVGNGFLLLIIASLMLWLDWRFAVAALSVAPLLFLAAFRYTRRIKKAARAARVSDGLLASVAQETLSSIRIVQGLAQEEQQDLRFGVQRSSSLEKYTESVRYQARIAPIVDFLSAVGLAAVMAFGASRVLAGELTTGDLVVFFAYVTNLYGPMKAMSRMSLVFNKAAIGAERVREVMNTQAEVTDRSGARVATRISGHISFERVSFGYEPGRAVLSDVSFAIIPGERVAIVGTTGAGKSTLVSLVPRLYDPTEGVIRIDGVDARDYTVRSLRDQVSMVLQEALLFSGTIRENIAFGRPDATDEEIETAARMAHAHEFIHKLPEGYDASVAERGASLSGGQKQRIAIARAILRNAPILILDEATSGLDASSERIVLDALERAAEGRTTLLIAHRLATIRCADRILVLEDGKIVEEGVEADLLALGGRYARLHAHQFGRQKPARSRLIEQTEKP